MPYDYLVEKRELFTDDGQRMFLRVRDFVMKQLKVSGAIRMEEAMNSAGSGSGWTMLACVDRMVELGELSEVTASSENAGQDRVFVSGSR